MNISLYNFEYSPQLCNLAKPAMEYLEHSIHVTFAAIRFFVFNIWLEFFIYLSWKPVKNV